MTKLPMIAAPNVVPFGKYKGQPIEVLRADQSYMNWLEGQEGIRRQYPWIFNVTNIVVGGEPAETPEHNHYQALFLDLEFAGDVVDAVRVRHGMPTRLATKIARRQETIGDRRRSLISNQEEASKYREKVKGKDPWAYDLDQLKKYEALITKNEADIKSLCELPQLTAPDIVNVVVEFEAKGLGRDGYTGKPLRFFPGAADVQICWEDSLQARIEIKPQMGDDYPAVLRQMKASECNVLYLVNYSGTGATLEQVQEIFRLSNILVLMHSQFWE